MQAKTPEEQAVDSYVNAHRVRFAPPDIVRIWWCGRVTREDFAGIIDAGYQQMGVRPHFVLADVSRMKSVDPDARKLAATDPRILNVEGIALIGTTFHTRVLMTMITKAIELFNRKEREKVQFFDSDAEALVWIAEKRERLRLNRAESEGNQLD